MPNYEYLALDLKGKTVSGNIDADSVRAARQQLKAKKLFPTDIKESRKSQTKSTQDILKALKGDSVSTLSLCVATRQLATLTGAGLPLVSALRALSEQTENQNLRKVMIDVREKVEEGSSLAKALRAHPKVFPRLYINMVESGEVAGNLNTVLDRLADYLEEQLELKRKVKSALTYPAVMLLVCSAVILALFVFVIPRIVDMFEKQGAILPLPTRVMIFISDVIVNYWFILIGLVVGLWFLFSWYYKTPKGRAVLDKLQLKLPIYGSIFVKVSSARVCQTLATLLNSGVQLLNALEITQKIIANQTISSALEVVREGVREGKSFAKELQKTNIFPTMMSHMIAVGEQSGELENMLERAGKAYKNEVDRTLDGLTSIIEPLMMIVVGLIVLAIVVSVMLPMVDLLDALQK